MYLTCLNTNSSYNFSGAPKVNSLSSQLKLKLNRLGPKNKFLNPLYVPENTCFEISSNQKNISSLLASVL